VLSVASLATRTWPAYPAMQPDYHPALAVHQAEALPARAAYTALHCAARSQVVMVGSGASDAGEAAGCAPCHNRSTGDTSLVGHDGLAGAW
jgi:hypothetical protein